MKQLVTKIVPLSMAMCEHLKPCESNPRQLRFSKPIFASYKAVNWLEREDGLTGTIDRPVVTASGRVVRGLARLGTLALGLQSKEPGVADVCRKLIQSGTVKIIQIPDNLPIALLRRISSDSDSTKESWNRAECFRQWKALVEEDGVSPTTASIMVGFTSRRQTFEELLKVSPTLRQAWIDAASDTPGALYVKDSDVAAAAKLATAHKAMFPSAKASDLGEEYAAKENEILTGNRKPSAKQTATRQEIQDVSGMFRESSLKLSGVDVANLLLVLSGYKPDNTIIEAHKGAFARYAKKLLAPAGKK